MDRDKFIKLAVEGKRLSILYEFHLEKGKTRLSPTEFMKFYEYMQELGREAQLKAILGSFYFDLEGFTFAVIRYYTEKFNIVTLRNKEGKIILTL